MVSNPELGPVASTLLPRFFVFGSPAAFAADHAARDRTTCSGAFGTTLGRLLVVQDDCPGGSRRLFILPPAASVVFDFIISDACVTFAVALASEYSAIAAVRLTASASAHITRPAPVADLQTPLLPFPVGTCVASVLLILFWGTPSFGSLNICWSP